MEVLGSGLDEVGRHAEALVVKEAELSMLRRVGARASSILAVQTNLANTYQALGRLEHSLQLERDVYDGSLRLLGEEHRDTIISVNNLAATLFKLKRFEEAKSLLRKIMPVARRVLGENYELTIAMRMSYAQSLYNDEGATLDDLHEAVTLLEENERITRRVFGGAHPLAMQMEHDLKKARAKLRAHEIAEAMLATTLGAGAADVGAALSTFGLARLALNVPVGLAADSVGRKPLLVGGALLNAAGHAASALAPDATSFAAARFVAGAGSAAYLGTAQVYLSDVAKPSLK